MVLQLREKVVAKSKAQTAKKHNLMNTYLNLLFVCIIVTSVLLSGCSHVNEGFQSTAAFKEANAHYSQGNYTAALSTYQQIIDTLPAAGDRALFEMGILYSSPGNLQKDYQKALESFQKISKGYPDSLYKKDSELMVFNIKNVTLKDLTIATQQAQIEALRHELQGRGDEIALLQKNSDVLAQEVKNKENEITVLQKEIFVIQKGQADKILIEKKERRLTLISKGKVLKTYQIALGGNPDGPKERQGDNKTPEGIYVIDARNKNSQYHRSLHISYPNEKDKKRAKKLGASPGGDIMIHGIKNGFSWVGDLHTEVDWTKGCIAVTDEEIEEIDALVPHGTVVEIRP